MAFTHFFADRNKGINQSEQKNNWRYGKGNVFCPSQLANSQESKNAEGNVDAILKEEKIESQHPGVILESQYQNGITDVTKEFLETAATKDNHGRITVKADGLFTTLDNVPLLNRSGDAHAIVFETKGAVGILVGSWRCLGLGIIQSMLKKFNDLGIDNSQIRISIGPGLDKDSYTIGQQSKEILEKTFGDAYSQAIHTVKAKNSSEKCRLDVVTLLDAYSKKLGFTVDASQFISTFDKTTWKKIKEQAMQDKNPALPLQFYAQQKHFGARQYVRCTRLAHRICEQFHIEAPAELKDLGNLNFEDIKNAGTTGRYNETGRCLNGVMKLKR